MADTHAVIAYAVMGLVVGLGSVIVTKGMYLIEDGFEKLPIHWMWWPAIGVSRWALSELLPLLR
jgi:H+/Cl- antiporter ClcA